MASFSKPPVIGVTNRADVLASLRMAEIVTQKPKLPVEILAMAIDRLAIPDLMRTARVSKQMQEMVYDDSRWVRLVSKMGCWDEVEARRKAGQAQQKLLAAQHVNGDIFDRRYRFGKAQTSNKFAKSARPVTVIFDSSLHGQGQLSPPVASVTPRPHSLNDGGFTAVNISSMLADDEEKRLSLALNVLNSVQSTRGEARQEYGKIYALLAPFYIDILRVKDFAVSLVCRKYSDPQDQAQMLSQLVRFAKTDESHGWQRRAEKLNDAIATFENLALQKLNEGLHVNDYDGIMRDYVNVLTTLNGGQAAIDFYLRENPLFIEQYKLGNPRDCLNELSPSSVSLEPSFVFFKRVAKLFNEQISIIDRLFPPSVDIMHPFIQKMVHEDLAKYIRPLIDEARELDMEAFLKVFSGVFEESLLFVNTLQHGRLSTEDFRSSLIKEIRKIFDPYLDTYLRSEVDFFQSKAEARIDEWNQTLSEQTASTESFLMSNINRQADKRDFLSTFKKVVMMPIYVLPSLSANRLTTPKPSPREEVFTKTHSFTSLPSRASTPVPVTPGSVSPAYRASTPVNFEAPTTELAAKAAVMNARLEGISSLFSIEVALNLLQTSKASLERISHFVKLGGEIGQRARDGCELVFRLLLDILGSHHIKVGFDKAVERLANYNSLQVGQDGQPGIAPLTTFLELVNVGDLIQQMVDVFFEQELVTPKFVDRNDSLNASVKEKKIFEQMLDERVAAGLNKGIDVLMNEVEYICSTTQAGNDFNPDATAELTSQEVDVGPTQTAVKVVDLVSKHTKMLQGNTDKHILDVFNQEVGLRLFTALCKHIKRQRISMGGAIKLISDMNLYFQYIHTLKNPNLLQYFKALRELSQLYLIDASDAKEMAVIISDTNTFSGIFRVEEVYEFAQRRADWYIVGKDVERAMYGVGCVMM